MTLQPRRRDATDVAAIFGTDDGWPPRVGDKVSNSTDTGDELIEGYVLDGDGESLLILCPVGRRGGVHYDVRTRWVRLDELDRSMTTRARSNLHPAQANNLLLAAIALPSTAVHDWLRYVGMAVTLRRGAA